ncbi:hypothetical protein [uncultured Oscillibacter sp.]|uniref:hypothetical protein n=1 Tax=uncultured Oscillibacter sp. TaxID=876091 RepID=UPI0025E42F68|nr:hypothetical protein [uncultured Oscillibacter sp.]
MINMDLPNLTPEQRTSLPHSAALASLTHVLDALNAMVLVLDSETRIRFLIRHTWKPMAVHS